VNVLQAVILTEGDKMLVTPTYHVLEMYKVHQDARLVPIEVNSQKLSFNGESIPAVSASASIAEDGNTHISLVNIDPKNQQEITIDLSDRKYKNLNGRLLTSKKLRDFNSFENPGYIKPEIFKGAKMKNNQISVTLPPFSVAVLALN
jgi:alpha-N-arabinofuranosidase